MEGFGSEIDCLQSPSLPDHIPSGGFRCRFPGCNARYQRKKHLNRHERSKHSQQEALDCSHCGAEFRRSDTLRRHIQRQHTGREAPKRAPKACVGCQTGRTRCGGGVPCDECVRRNVHCSFQGEGSIAAVQQRQSSTPHPSVPDLDRLDSHRMENRQHWIDRYFEIFHPRWPFLHRGTFDMRKEPPLLLQSMMAIGMWVSGEEPAQSAAVELSNTFNSAIRGQREKWDASEVEGACSACTWPIATYQALLLHFILAVLMKADGVVNLDLKASISTADLDLLKSLVGSCRKLGMFCYPNMLSKFTETDLPSLVWVGVEEFKRFNVALYRLCAKLSNSSTEGEPLLPASELQFPIPSNDALWNSVKRDEWEANAKEEGMISLEDDLQARWISSHADAIKFLEL